MRRIRIKQPEGFFTARLQKHSRQRSFAGPLPRTVRLKEIGFFVSVAVGWRFDFVYFYQRRQPWGNDIQWMFIQIDRTQLTSVFEDQPSKNRPKLQSKQGSFEIWVLGIYTDYI